MSKGKGSKMQELILLGAFIAFYFALQMWILPRFGIST